MIPKDKCASCNKHDANLTQYGGWYYHKTCLDKLLAMPLTDDTRKMKRRLSNAFSKLLKED